jgi:hypothetical protein
MTDREVPDMPLSSQSRGMSVVQDELFRVDIEGSLTADSGKELKTDSKRAFDGDITRLLDQNIGNVLHYRKLDPNVFRPHTMPLRRAGERVPLSVYLQGADAIRAHPDNRRTDPAIFTKASYQGQEMVGDLLCHKVVVDRGKNVAGAEVRTSWRIFWLAEDRNLLPVKTEGFASRLSAEIPIEVGQMLTLQELEPGVWFPSSYLHLVYDEISLMDNGVAVPCWRDEYTITDVRLNPGHEKEFFQEIDFPEGTHVVEIDQDHQAVPRKEDAAAGEFRGSRFSWWLVFANLAVMSTVGLVYAWRRFRSTRDLAAQ